METEEKLKLVIESAEELKADRIETLPLEGKTLLADYFVVCSGNSDVHIRSIANKVQDAMEKAGVKCGRMEGYSSAVWILLDYGDVVAHVMAHEQREYYRLEDFWTKAPAIEQMRQQEESHRDE